ncbi:hypothetical protein HN682_04300 [Candidatus Peregrinibacteria bacterium]|nr:hypothetical protein [Candidatus Peregrinibacteria bacterium]
MTTSAFRYKLNTYGEEFQESMGDKIEDNKLQVFLLSFFKMLASLIKSDVLTKHQLFTLTREFLQLTEKRLKISIKTKLISEFEAQIKEIKPPTINPIPGGRTPGISNPNPTKYSGWAGPITFVIMLVGIFLFFTLYPSEVNIPVNVSPVIEEVVEVQKIIPVVEDEPTINTYRDYLDYPKVYHDQEIEMTGTYITREEERENKFYVDSYLQDDEGDTIKLKGTEGRQLEQGKTYNISGTFKNWPTGAGLDVKKVKENEKDI